MLGDQRISVRTIFKKGMRKQNKIGYRKAKFKNIQKRKERILYSRVSSHRAHHVRLNFFFFGLSKALRLVDLENAFLDFIRTF